MKYAFRIIFVILFQTFLTACVTTQKYEITKNNPVTNFPSEYAIVVGSFTMMSEVYTREVSFRRIGAKDRYYISQGLTFERNDFKGIIDGIGMVYAYAVPAGEYEIFDYRLYFNDGFVSKTWTPNEAFSIPFTLTPGSVTYIGDIETIPTYGRNFLGIEVEGGGYFKISDQSVRDLPILKARFPDIAWDKLTIALPRPGNAPQGPFVFE